MRWRFDPLFSLKILYTTHGEGSATEDLSAAQVFNFEPTPITAHRFKQLGWVSKSWPGVCTVYGEKAFAADGTASLRSLPASGEQLTFFMRLGNAALLNKTEPFAKATPPATQTPLPEFSGRTRTLYLDNRAPVAQPRGEFSLSPNEVNTVQLASVFPPVFPFASPKPNVTELKFTALKPNGSTFEIKLNQPRQDEEVKVPENAYRLEQNPGGHVETIILSTDMPKGNVLGMIGIFEPAGGWEPFKRYRIDFKGTQL